MRPGCAIFTRTPHSVHQVRAHVAGYHALKAAGSRWSAWPCTTWSYCPPVAPKRTSPRPSEPRAGTTSPCSVTGSSTATTPLLSRTNFCPTCQRRGRHGRSPSPAGLHGAHLPPRLLRPQWRREWLGFVAVDEPGAPRTTIDWIIRLEGLHRVITQAHERYKLPAIYITENGAPLDDQPDGKAVPRRRPDGLFCVPGSVGSSRLRRHKATTWHRVQIRAGATRSGANAIS
jgi:hypothetical protein